jgi:hypothetical protein
MQGHGIDWDLHVVEDPRKVLTLAHLLAFNVQELGRMRHWVEDNQRAFRQLQGEDCPFAWRQVDSLECDFSQQLLQIRWKINGRTPENLAVIFGCGQFVGVVSRDLTQAGAHREGHFDQVVERRLIARSAKGTTVLGTIEGLETFIGGEHAGATWAHDVP